MANRGRIVQCMAAALLTVATAGWAQTVTKLADGFEYGGWQASANSTAAGRVAVVDEGDASVDSQRSLLIEASFAGKFGGFSAEAARPLIVPGELKSVRVRYKIADARFGLRMLFRDGWGRADIAGAPIQWEMKTVRDGQWHVAEFQVPANWVQPISIAGFGTHNWEAKTDTIKVPIYVDHLEVTTDLTDVDPATGALKTWTRETTPAKPELALKTSPTAPLRSVGASMPVDGNVFTRTEPTASVKLQNWTQGALTAAVHSQVLDAQGAVVIDDTRSLPLDSVAGFDLPLKLSKFGHYTLRVSADFGDGTKQRRETLFAKIPQSRALTEAEKEASPYGLNYHGAGRLLLRPFRDAGIVWFREYAFQYEWLSRGKGADGSWANWPFYPRMLQAYADVDAKVVAVLQGSITAPAVQNGKVVGPLGPNLEWTRTIADTMLQFPQVKNWEMSNEYDLKAQNAAAERLVNWKNYQLYHAKLGELVQLFGGGEWRAIENGRAGVYPQLVKECVESGLFDKIGVVNTHHYTGTDAPEENVGNYNTTSDAWGGKPPTLLFDDLRAVTRAGRVDGKPREHWLTEFGWDTLAGPVVTPYEQAVFLPREWMLTMAAGCSKAFWFYHFDSPNPSTFFDGCGLMTADAEPKLALASLAGLTSVLPSPKFVGTINAGPNTQGYVFEQDGKLVAALFSIRGEGPTVDLQAERVVDYLGNEVSGKQLKLTMAPTYAVGIAKDSPLFKQSAYSIDSDNMVVASLGDPIESTVMIANNRGTSIDSEISVAVAEGWQVETPTLTATVPAGETKKLAVKFTVGANDDARERNVILTFREGGVVVKEQPLRVMLQPRVALTVDPIVGAPGKTQLSVKIGNRSRRAVDGAVTFALPKGWSVADATLTAAGLKPGEQRTLTTELTWSPNWSAGESAMATLNAAGTIISKPVIPNRLALHRAPANVKIDADLSDWNPRHELPAWTLGSTHGQPNAALYLAWTSDGLYGAVDVRDSKIENRKPSDFWAGDVLELFIDSGNDKRERRYEPGDHQFFLVPLPAQGRAFAGRWKVANEIAATQNDITEIKTASKKSGDGYVMEFFIPAAQIQKYQPGKPIGLNLNLTVIGKDAKREVFWSRSKSTNANVQPNSWGTVELLD